MEEMNSMMNMSAILSAIPNLNFPGSLCLDESEAPSPEEFEQIRAKRYNASEGDLNEEDGYNCPECQNRGRFAFVDENLALRFRECRCMNARRSKRILSRSGLDALVARCKFSSYEQRFDWQKDAYQKAKAYASDPEGWLVLSGRSGTGKTHLCTAVCRELMLKGLPVRYMMWRDEAAKLKFGDEAQALLWKYQTIRVLYVDDFLKVGKHERPTQADMNLAFQLLNHRYNDPKLLTIISTELTPQEIIDLDEAVGSRIFERTKGGRFILFGESAQNWRLIG